MSRKGFKALMIALAAFAGIYVAVGYLILNGPVMP